ncbi:signal peptidase I [Caldibacillus thermolactis]|uniref:Signal peptidase I n=1 Tax=Pallidibacillus thermolactis TaxID=251051 RepID=A0ABT2WCB4_9BACI|nr:signal peptidase I [Pallidibacillus thermolactis]MCU9593112.1 signal peptidase I [Pallidibacillus thermolactis]
MEVILLTKKSELWEWIKILTIAAALAAVIRFFLFTPIIVDGESMMPTLEDRDRMIVNKLSYKLGDIDRFDIVVFKVSDKKDYIKRVIGLPGEYIEYKNDTLYVDGVKYDEPYLDEYRKEYHQIYMGGPLTPDFSYEVPEGHVFVMGDNRRFSRDSRDYTVGPIPIENILGKASIIYWPLEDIKIIN